MNKIENKKENNSIDLNKKINEVVEKRQKNLVEYLKHHPFKQLKSENDYNQSSEAFINFDNNIKIALDNLKFITKERYDWIISNEIIEKYKNILQIIGGLSLNFDKYTKSNLEFFSSIGYFIKEYYFEMEISFIINIVRKDEIVNEVVNSDLDKDIFSWYFCYFQIDESIEMIIYVSFLNKKVIEYTVKRKYKKKISAKIELVSIIKTRSKYIDLFWIELLHYKKSQHYEKLINFKNEQLQIINRFLKNTLVRSEQNKIRNERLQDIIAEKDEIIKKLKNSKKDKKKEPLPEFKNKPLKRWSELTLYIDVEKSKETGIWGNWKKIYYCLNPKKEIPLTKKLLMSLQQYKNSSYRNTANERQRKKRLNDYLINCFNKQDKKSRPIDEHYQINFNIEIRNLYKEYRERTGKKSDVTDRNM